MRGEKERSYGRVWRDPFGGRRLGEWRRRVSWPFLFALALCGVQRFVPALELDAWLRTAGEVLASPARLFPRPDPRTVDHAFREIDARSGIDSSREALRIAAARASAPRDRRLLRGDAPSEEVECPAPSACFVEVLLKPLGGSLRWILAAELIPTALEIDPEGAIALWGDCVVGVARREKHGERAELVLATEKGQRLPVVYRAAGGGIGSGVLVAGPFATPSGTEAAFRLLHPTSDPLSPEEPLRLSAGPALYRAAIAEWSSGGALGAEARHLEAAEGFLVARFRAQRSFADGWFADAVFEPALVHGVHLAGVKAASCRAIDATSEVRGELSDVNDIDAGSRSAGLRCGGGAGLARGDAVLAAGRLAGDVAVLTPWSARVSALDAAGRTCEALLLTSEGDVHFLGRVRSLGTPGGTWSIAMDRALPSGLSGELYSGASASAGWNGVRIGHARVAAGGSRLELAPVTWGEGDEVAVLARRDG